MLPARTHAVTHAHDTIRVELPGRSYDVVVGAGLLASIGERLAALVSRRRAAVVTNDVVRGLHGDAVLGALGAAGFETTLVALPDGEAHKTMASVAMIHDRLLGWGVDRGTPVIALGGGVVGDVAGFAAATLLRGVPVVQVPTTLLAQVDSSIGGKTGVNHPTGKNLVGAFHQPVLVLADVATLATVPRRELVAGVAEVVKYGVIGDPELFETLEARAGDLVDGDDDLLTAVVARCARQKAAVVVADEREERGARAVLNFGHTVGHAIETVTEYRRFLHGEAVAMGMVAAARVSEAIGVAEAGTGGRIAGVLVRAGLPHEMPVELRTPALAAAMQRDKKAAGGRVRFVAVERIGRTRFVELTGSEIQRHL
jgi:3-dehydroquinate synthase